MKIAVITATKGTVEFEGPIVQVRPDADGELNVTVVDEHLEPVEFAYFSRGKWDYARQLEAPTPEALLRFEEKITKMKRDHDHNGNGRRAGALGQYM